MRLSYFVAVTFTGLLACAAASDSAKTVAASNDQVLSNRELIDTGANDNEKRFLRVNQDTDDESDDSKTAKEAAASTKEEADSEDNDEDRFSLIQMSNTPRYYLWFENEMTPRDVREDLGLRSDSIKLVKRSIYKGYVKYYNNHCTYYENRKKAFCEAEEY
ncbi:hypothetical protein PI124_g16541 [Phytophthora idaei]|nr:hypothetical protein PI125_g13674 [Phytophthora idaei]KAG3145600.1 hypothetical protein PI126_g13662 [Phytophthora idaei]KAG3238494.1 hypothetical protein PI124_g16541 [Phytophthora idaei]